MTSRNLFAGAFASVFLLLFGVTAPSHALTYNVTNFVLGVNSVTGTITTNGHFGVLSSTDITGWNLAVHAGPDIGISIGANPFMLGNPLLASSSVIDFEPTSGTVGFVNGPVIWELLGSSITPPFGGMQFVTLFENNTVPFTAPVSDFPIAVADLTPPADTPLPATLPLFATGLSALGLMVWRRRPKALAV